jgi:hypothetical protein
MDRICCSKITHDIEIRRLCNMVHQKANMIFGIQWTSLSGEMIQPKNCDLSRLLNRKKIEILIVPTTFGTLWINVFLQRMVSEGQPKWLGHTSERLRLPSTLEINLLVLFLIVPGKVSGYWEQIVFSLYICVIIF